MGKQAQIDSINFCPWRPGLQVQTEIFSKEIGGGGGVVCCPIAQDGAQVDVASLWLLRIEVKLTQVVVALTEELSHMP